jgi:uncharacterized protein YuzE
MKGRLIASLTAVSLIFKVEVLVGSGLCFRPFSTSSFAKTYGDSGYNEAMFLQQTSDGGYIIAGVSAHKVLVIKTDERGNMQWGKTYAAGTDNIAYAVHQTSDGGYIIAGVTTLGVGNSDALLIKIDANGNVVWGKSYGGTSYDVLYSVQQTSDGGYILAGWTNSFGAGNRDILLIKTDPNGNVEWVKVWGGSADDIAQAVKISSDGGYILFGTTFSFGAGDADFLLIKTDPSGNIQWSKTYGGTIEERGFSFHQTPDGGYVLVGSTYSFGIGGDILLIKTDANGNIQWSKIYGGSDYDWPYSLDRIADGGYILAGPTHSFSTSADIFLIKMDENGNVVWSKTYGGAGFDWAFSVKTTSDGGYAVAGWTTSYGAGSTDVFLVKTDGNGNIGSCGIVQSVTPSSSSVSPVENSITVSATSPSITISNPSITVSNVSFAISEPCPLSVHEICPNNRPLISTYKDGVLIRILGEFEAKIYKVSGDLIKEFKGKNEARIKLGRGAYFLEVKTQGETIRKKVIIR